MRQRVAFIKKVTLLYNLYVSLFQELKESKAKIFQLENDLSFLRSLEKENAVLKSQVLATNCITETNFSSSRYLRDNLKVKDWVNYRSKLSSLMRHSLGLSFVRSISMLILY